MLIEWPLKEVEPTKYWLSNLPADIRISDMVNTAKMRWRIEQDYRELKQEFGLSHYDGRGWTGFHHHATVCIAAYGFLLAQRLQNASKKTAPIDQKRLPYPKITNLAAAGRTQRHVPDSIPTLRYLVSMQLARRLRRCPCCGSVVMRA